MACRWSVACARIASGQDTGLRLRELDEQGNARDVASIDVPAPGPTAYGARWDLAHKRALVITHRNSGDGPAHDYWLVDFGWGTPPTVAIDPAPPESTPAPFTTPASSSSSGSAASSSSSPSRSGPSFPLLTQDQANGLFDGFLLHGFLSATDGLRRGFQRLIDDANLVTNTAPDWTYQQSTVLALQRAVQVMSNSMLAPLIFWMGASDLAATERSALAT